MGLLLKSATFRWLEIRVGDYLNIFPRGKFCGPWLQVCLGFCWKLPDITQLKITNCGQVIQNWRWVSLENFPKWPTNWTKGSQRANCFNRRTDQPRGRFAHKNRGWVRFQIITGLVKGKGKELDFNMQKKSITDLFPHFVQGPSHSLVTWRGHTNLAWFRRAMAYSFSYFLPMAWLIVRWLIMTCKRIASNCLVRNLKHRDHLIGSLFHQFNTANRAI